MYRETRSQKVAAESKGSGFCFHLCDTQDQTSPALSLSHRLSAGVVFNTADFVISRRTLWILSLCWIRVGFWGQSDWSSAGALSMQVWSGPCNLSFKMCVESYVVIQGTGLNRFNVVIGSFQDWGSEFYQRETPTSFTQSHCCVLSWKTGNTAKMDLRDYGYGL